MTLDEAVGAFYYSPSEETAKNLSDVTKTYLERDLISYQAASIYLNAADCYLWIKVQSPIRCEK